MRILARGLSQKLSYHLGYVSRAKNEALAGLMDAGKLLFGKVEIISWRGDWLEIQVRFFMRDF